MCVFLMFLNSSFLLSFVSIYTKKLKKIHQKSLRSKKNQVASHLNKQRKIIIN